MQPLETRLLAKVRVNAETDCWEWQGATNALGYGRIRLPGKNGGVAFAHRAAYELFVGPIPVGLVMDHLCRNPSCCNPEHLEPVPQKVNSDRGRNPARATCAKGHAAEDQVMRVNQGKLRRVCVPCGRDRARESARRKRECSA